ncbi:MAG: RICIN domain-containing protein, partial [Bacteroidaceae bacterium]|nr:RICIN domain-containing protein [Bacteroidaceae bacterium]
MGKVRVILAIMLMVAVAAMGDVVTGISSTTRYRIESLYFLGSSAAIGANHNVNSPLCMTMDDAASEADCWWYFVEQGSGTGKYALKNASTGQYMTLDDQYTNSPQILRYAHLSSYVEGEASLWYICNTTSSDDTEIFYFQSVGNESFFFNVRTGTYVLGAYSKSGIPYGLNETFNIYDSQGRQFHTGGGSGPDPIDPVPTDSTQMEPIEGKVLFVYRADGKVEAVPEMYIENTSGIKIDDSQCSMLNAQCSITTTAGGPSFVYQDYEVDSLSYVAPELPAFNSFKFNNKYNPHIIEDAIGVFDEDTLITVSVVG